MTFYDRVRDVHNVICPDFSTPNKMCIATDFIQRSNYVNDSNEALVLSYLQRKFHST